MNPNHRSFSSLILILFALFVFLPVPGRASLPQLKKSTGLTITHSNLPADYQYKFTLLTGDIVYLTGKIEEKWIGMVYPAPRPYMIGFSAFSSHIKGKKSTFIIPSDVMHLLSDVIDPNFFNIEFLIGNKIKRTCTG